jgi:hypothetical protein
MEFSLVDFLKYLVTPAGGALVVLYLMKEIGTLAILEPAIKRFVGIGLCLLVSIIATSGLFFLKVYTVIDANLVFQVFMEAFLIAQSLQLITAPSTMPALPTAAVDGIRSVTTVIRVIPIKLKGFGWW